MKSPRRVEVITLPMFRLINDNHDLSIAIEGQLMFGILMFGCCRAKLDPIWARKAKMVFFKIFA